MNSLILQKLADCARSTARLFEKSKLNKIITAVHEKFSGWWKDSKFVALFKKESGQDGLFTKISYFPISFFETVRKSIGKWLTEKIENSFFVDIAKTYVNNVLAMNTRFFGCMLLAAVIINNTLTRNLGILDFAFAIISVLAVIFNYNVTDFFDGSKIVGFLKKMFGIECQISDIYKKQHIGSTKSLVISVLFGIGVGCLPAKISILFFAGIIGFVTVMSNPIVGVFAAVAAAPFVPTMILAGVCILTTLSFIVKAVTHADFTWRRDGIGIGLFLILLLASSLFSFAPVKSLMVWSMYLVFAGFFFVIINVVRTKEQVISLLRVFVIAGAIVAIYGVLQYVFGWNTSNAWIDEDMFEEATMRAYSTMENPNVLGEYLLLLIPFAALFVLKQENTKLQKITYGSIFLISCLCMVFTQSRGCWLGLLLSLAIFITFYNGKLWTLVPFILLALPFFMPEAMVDRMMSVGNMEDSSTSYRVFIWKGSFRMLSDFWIGGIGMGEGAFRSVYPLYSYSGIIAPHAHNTFLQLVVEGGIGVLAVFLYMMIKFLKKIASVFSSVNKNSNDGLCALAIGSGVCGFLLQSMFDYTFYNYRMMAMFFMVLGIGIVLRTCKGEEK